MSVPVEFHELQFPVVSNWGHWYETPSLRYLQREGTTTQPARLQQKFERKGLDGSGAVCVTETKWCDVPTVYDDRQFNAR